MGIEKREGDSRQHKVVANKRKRMERRVKELNKRYPNSQYAIEERTSKGRGDKVYPVMNMVRVKGRKPHKIKKGQTNG
jgi:hypothetical protein